MSSNSFMFKLGMTLEATCMFLAHKWTNHLARLLSGSEQIGEAFPEHSQGESEGKFLEHRGLPKWQCHGQGGTLLPSVILKVSQTRERKQLLLALPPPPTARKNDFAIQ